MTGPTATAQAALRAALEAAHRILNDTTADVPNDAVNRLPPGRANPIGSSYAHVALAEDTIVNGLLKGGAPLWAADWAGRTGTDRPMPMPGAVQGDLGEWYHTVQVDLPACRQYAGAVFAASEEFIGSADDTTLAREVDTPFGRMPLAVMFSVLVIGHCNNLCGEIAAIKGTFGMRGYPF